MTGGRASMIWLVVFVAIVGLFAGVWLLPHLQRVSDQTQRLAMLEEEGETLSLRVQELTRQLNTMLSDESEPENDSDPSLAAAQAMVRREAEKRLENVRVLAETQASLGQASATIETLQARVGELESNLAELSSKNGVLRQSEEELRDQLERSNRVIEAMRTELRDNSDRLVKLEVRNRRLREENDANQEKLTRWTKLMGDLESLQRRRESVLTNIVRRYREVGDEYQTVTLRADSPEQSSSGASLDLSRIQTALSLADEELDQLRTLNARVSLIQKELAK